MCSCNKKNWLCHCSDSVGKYCSDSVGKYWAKRKKICLIQSIIHSLGMTQAIHIYAPGLSPLFSLIRNPNCMSSIRTSIELEKFRYKQGKEH